MGQQADLISACLPWGMKTIWPGNMKKYYQALYDGALYGVALTTDGCIAAEMRYAKKMRLIVIADPKTFTVTHQCQNNNSELACWHLAAAVDLIAFVQKKYIFLGKGPVASVNPVHKYINTDDVIGVKDITADYLAYKSLEPREGNFVIKIDPSLAIKPKSNKPKSGWLSRLAKLLIPAAFGGWF